MGIKLDAVIVTVEEDTYPFSKREDILPPKHTKENRVGRCRKCETWFHVSELIRFVQSWDVDEFKVEYECLRCYDGIFSSHPRPGQGVP